MADSSKKPPRLICAKQACYILDIAPATFFRRLQDGTIRQGVKIGPRLRRWDEEYIISVARDGTPPPKSPKRDAAE